MLTRRDLLIGGALAGVGVALPRRARAFGDSSLVDIAEIDLGAGSLSRPDAWERLLNEVEQTTSVECDPAPVRVTPASADLFRHPFCALIGDADFATDDTTLEQLGRYLSYGGFLLVDDVTGADSSGFDRAVRELCSTLFPTRPLAPLPSSHSVYRSFFLIDRPVGRVARHPYLEGITIDGTESRGGYSPLIYCRNDLSGALDRSISGLNRQACIPGGESQRREAVKLGINLVMYCLTTDYKKDQAHVKKLLEDHRLDGDWNLPGETP